ncbi:MAG: phosphotyrosine protein phosphatase [Candidatus Pacearchaeota archaeon]
MKKRLLFICTENIHRSPTAESLFKKSKKYEAKSAGISIFSEKMINEEALKWADIIFVMEDFHKKIIAEYFPDIKDKIIVLNIPDIYVRNDPKLIGILIKRLKENKIEV